MDQPLRFGPIYVRLLPGSDGPIFAAPVSLRSIALNMPRPGWQVNSEDGGFSKRLAKRMSPCDGRINAHHRACGDDFLLESGPAAGSGACD